MSYLQSYSSFFSFGMSIETNLNGYQKKKYVCKLLYMYILGWDIEFGHLEAVNLIASTKYSEKQIVSDGWDMGDIWTDCRTKLGISGSDTLVSREQRSHSFGGQFDKEGSWWYEWNQQLLGTSCYCQYWWSRNGWISRSRCTSLAHFTVSQAIETRFMVKLLTSCYIQYIQELRQEESSIDFIASLQKASRCLACHGLGGSYCVIDGWLWFGKQITGWEGYYIY